MKTFDEVFEDRTKFGTKIQTNEYHKVGSFPIIDQGQDLIAGFTDRKEGLFSDVPAIIFGDHTRVVKYVDRPFFLGADGVKVLRSRFVGANYKYLYYCLKNARIPNTGYNRHYKWLKELQIQYPDLKKQSQIVSVLEGISACIELRKKQLCMFDNLIKARFVEMFGDSNNSKGYPLVKVQDVAEIQVGVVVKPAQYYTDAEHGVKAFRSLNIGELSIKDDDWVYFNEEGQRKNSKSILKENDLVIVRSGAPGTACVVTKQFEGSNAVDVIIAHPDAEKVNPYYLCAFTNFPHGKRQIDKGTGGAAQQHFNVGKYKEMDLILPPKEEQDRFVAFVAQVNKSKVVVQKALDKTQHLFDSLMQKYFG